MSWLDTLQNRWKAKNILQVILILIVFCCTGLTIVYLMKPILRSLFGGAAVPGWALVLYYILILPVYNIFLLFYGFIFGQFLFFWNFERRLLNRILSIFRKN